VDGDEVGVLDVAKFRIAVWLAEKDGAGILEKLPQ